MSVPSTYLGKRPLFALGHKDRELFGRARRHASTFTYLPAYLHPTYTFNNSQMTNTNGPRRRTRYDSAACGPRGPRMRVYELTIPTSPPLTRQGRAGRGQSRGRHVFGADVRDMHGMDVMRGITCPGIEPFPFYIPT